MPTSDELADPWFRSEFGDDYLPPPEPDGYTAPDVVDPYVDFYRSEPHPEPHWPAVVEPTVWESHPVWSDAEMQAMLRSLVKLEDTE